MDIATKYNIQKQYLKVLLDEENDEKYDELEKEKNTLYTELEKTKTENERIQDALAETQQNLDIACLALNTKTNENEDLKKEIKNLEKENKENKKEIKNIKENVKKPVTINNDMDLFENIKNEKCIKFFNNDDDSRILDDSFVFEYNKKGVIYNKRKIVGMFERKGTTVQYYSVNKVTSNKVAKIILENVLIKSDKDTFDAKLKYGRGSGKKISNMSWIKLLETQPKMNSKLKKFESNEHYEFIYMENDGSKYIIKNGEKIYR